MTCPSSVVIGQNLVFSVCTHNPASARLTDADALPTYRLYEDEVAVPILTGTMAILDDAGTTGFYSELIACTTANGFEVGRNYTVYIEATVGTDTGGISYGFTVIASIFGPGAIEFTYTLTSTVDGTPIDEADVWVTTDAGGLNIIASGETDAAGVVVFWLDAGNYFFWRQCDGWTFVNPDLETVS